MQLKQKRCYTLLVMEEAAHTQTPDARLFRDVFNASPIGIVVENLEGQPLFVNPAFCSMLGFSEEELRSKHCVDFSPPEDAEKDWALFQQLRAGSIDHYQLEKRYFRRDGSLVWGNLTISLLQVHPSPLVLAMVEDITDKKQADEARLRHAAIVESSEDAIASVTLDGVIASWNAGAENIFGYTESEAVGKSVTILVPPERPDEENKILETLKAGRRIDQFDTVRVTKAGERINVSLTISPIKDSTGKVVGFSGVSRNITERKRADEALRASEERLRLAQQAARIGTFEWNIRTDANTWTPELEAMYGLPPCGFGGTQAFENLIYCDDRARLRELIESALRTGRPMTGEWRVIWADGSVHWIAGSWQVLMDESGKPSRVVGVNMDVTERKRTEERLREYEKVVEGAEDMIGVVDREYRFLLANRQYLKMRNMAREQVVGCLIPDVLGKEVFETVIKPKLDECFQGKVVRYEMKFSYPTVGEKYLLLSYYPIEAVNGTIDRAACILHDITDRKRAEEALSAVTRKLIEAQEQERSRIGRELHDDINQRLAMLAIGLEQLRNDPLNVRSRLQELWEETTAISSEVQALSHELHSSKLEYLGFVSYMRSWCNGFSERQKIQIDFRSDMSSPLPFEIGLSVFRVLQEALHNAVKHSGAKKVEVQVAEQSNEVHLVVKDSGNGFDLEAAKLGSGLGLTSMQERVRLVNGAISFESKPMAGTTIRVRVPFNSEHAAQRAAG